MKKKKRSSAELMYELSKLRDERRRIVDTAEAEKRELTPEELDKVSDLRQKIARLNEEKDRLEEELNNLEGDEDEEGRSDDEEPNEEEPRGKRSRGAKGGRSLIVRAMRELYRGQLSDEMRKISELGTKELRASGLDVGGRGIVLPTESRTITAMDNGEYTIANELQNVLDPLRNNLVLTQAGATFLTGLVGNITIPRYSGGEAHWKGETDPAEASDVFFEGVELSPKRLTTVIEVSRQFLLQDSVDAEGAILRDLTACIQTKLESTILGADKIANAPAGLFYLQTNVGAGFVNGPTDKGVASYKRLVDIEAKVEDSNALLGNLCYITNARGRAVLRSTLRDKGVPGYLTNEDGTQVNGYKLLVTKGVPSIGGEEGLLFANFADLVIGQWGGFEIIVDPYTRADSGVVRFILTTYWDAAFRRPESYAIASIKA